VISETGGFAQRFGRYLERVPEGREDTFEYCVGRGHNPKAVLGTLLYLENEEMTKAKAAEESDTSTVSIRSNQKYILENDLLNLQNKGDEE